MMEEYSERLMGLACKVLEVLSDAIGLEKAALKNACVDMEQKIVVNYFPKRPKPDLPLGMRHTDHGIITLLLQDQVSCLQATGDNGKTWVTVPLVPGALLINLGTLVSLVLSHSFSHSVSLHFSSFFLTL